MQAVGLFVALQLIEGLTVLTVPVVGLMEILTTGTEIFVASVTLATLIETDFVTEPPVPLQVSVYVLFSTMLVNVLVLERYRSPVQLPDDIHKVEFVDAHVSVTLPLCGTTVGLAENVSVGAAVEVETFDEDVAVDVTDISGVVSPLSSIAAVLPSSLRNDKEDCETT